MDKREEKALAIRLTHNLKDCTDMANDLGLKALKDRLSTEEITLLRLIADGEFDDD
jgi:hypothetical protein